MELQLEGKFKTAEQLGLGEKQYCGLVKTLALLEAGILDSENEYMSRFDMGSWIKPTQCGTVCCIGGTAQVIMGGAPLYNGFHGHRRNVRGALEPHDSELFGLFYPGREGQAARRTHPGWGASTKQAGVALRGYLETGKADWDAAMRTPR